MSRSRRNTLFAAALLFFVLPGLSHVRPGVAPVSAARSPALLVPPGDVGPPAPSSLPDDDDGIDLARRPPATAPRARWTELAPPARAEHAAIFDERHRRLVLFGGWLGGSAMRNDVWVLALEGRSRWERIEPEGAGPSARMGAAAVYDRHRDRMLVIGGRDAFGARSDVWELALAGRARWRELHPIGEPPPGRCHHTATLDPEHDRVIVFGGSVGELPDGLEDLWQLTLGRVAMWLPLSPAGARPVGRSSHVAVYAPDLHGILVYGGNARQMLSPWNWTWAGLTDTWFLTTRGTLAWTNLSTRLAGSPPTSATEGAVAAYDAVTGRMMMAGGRTWWHPCYPVDCGWGGAGTLCWLSMRDSAWVYPALTGAIPIGREHPVAAVDLVRRRFVVHGGESDYAGSTLSMSDTWAFPLDGPASWSRVLPDSAPPAFGGWGDGAQTCVYDAARRRLLRWTGTELWSCDVEGERRWTRLFPAGEAPPARHDHIVLLDPVQDRMIVHGGVNSLVPWPAAYLTDTWALPLHGPLAWSHLATSGPAPLLDGACAVYDPRRGSMFAFSGQPYGSRNSVWELPLGDSLVWSEYLHRVPGAGWPAPAAFSTAIYDSRRDQMVRFGGSVPGADDPYGVNDTWALVLSGPPAWEPINPMTSSPDVPRKRWNHAAVYDGANDRMLVFGGFDGGAFSAGPWDDVWSLDLAARTWSRLESDGGRFPRWERPTVAFDARRATVTVLEQGCAWVLDLGKGRGCGRDDPSSIVAMADAAPAAAAGLRLALHGVRPNPALREMLCEFTLPAAAPASLQLLDVAGRRVWSQDVGALGPGRHAVTIPAEGRRPAGVYLLALAQSGAKVTTKVVLLR
jgi:hypothetical protein